MKEVEINKNIKLSEHFKLAELCKTSYHPLDGNIPSHVAIENLRNICEGWLEDLRFSYNQLYGFQESGDSSQESGDGGPVTIGSPEELAASGDLGRFIERQNIVFDKETLTIKVKK